jgi:predicted permease
MPISFPGAMPDSAVRAVVRRVETRLGVEPGVRGSGLTSTTPLSNSRWGTSFEIPGRPPARPGEQLTANDQHITPGYFAAMGIRVVRGRGIEWRDAADAPRVAVINRFMAESMWPGSDPVGRTVTVDSVPWTIVGVTTDVRHGGLDEPVHPELYRSIEQAVARASDLEVWTTGDPSAMRDAVRRIVAEADPGVAVGEPMTMRDMEARHVSVFALLAGVLSVFAAITMIIAVVGLYGVIAYGVAQRTREIAVRIALGAGRGDILRDVAGGAVRLTVIGAAFGATGAFAFAQLLRSMLYGVSASDPRTPLLVAAALLAVATVAALVPAWRASRVNPAVSLRE